MWIWYRYVCCFIVLSIHTPHFTHSFTLYSFTPRHAHHLHYMTKTTIYKQWGASMYTYHSLCQLILMLLQGEAVVRDGIYSTDENMKFLLQGAYFFQQGTLLLLAHPTKYVIRAGVVRSGAGWLCSLFFLSFSSSFLF